MQRKIAVLGLGYIGLPVAVAFGKTKETLGFDINIQRINELRAGKDRTGEINQADLRGSQIRYTHDAADLKWADFYIVAVPTPVDEARRPDLTPMIRASEFIGKSLKKGDIVVYESTVYPGVTEEVCGPILEKLSGLRCGVDFKLGYSPERINPGDKEHTFTNIKKIVSGQDLQTTEAVAQVYGSVVTAGVFRAQSIKVAEAAKVIENTQRDLNIALMNELAIIFDMLKIDTLSVLEAAGTKWNFLKFRPGLVGGHCIGVDPYYLTHRAEEVGYIPQVILAGRRINDEMGKFIAQKTAKLLAKNGTPLGGSTVTIFGITFKENCPDTRNTRVIDIIRELQEYGVNIQVCDPVADQAEAEHEYGIRLTSFSALKPASAIIFAVAHSQFRDIADADLRKLFHPNQRKIIIDVKGIVKDSDKLPEDVHFWRL